MRLPRSAALALALTLFGALAAPAVPAQAAERSLAFGYVAWWGQDQWKTQALENLDRLMFMEVQVGPDGGFANSHGWPQRWQGLRDEAAKQGVPLDVGVTLFDPAVFAAVFGSAKNRRRLGDGVLELARGAGVSGIHLDVEIYEAVDPKLALQYRAFVVELAQRIRQLKPQRLLSVFLTPQADKGLYDAATLRSVDHMVLQGYDAHWLGAAKAGPMSPLAGSDPGNWKAMLAMADQLGVPRDRAVFSFPLFAYEWPVRPCQPRGATLGKGDSLSFVALPEAVGAGFKGDVHSRVALYGATQDPLSGSAFYQLPAENGKCTVGWFEDWWSLSRKADWVAEQKLAGLAFFALGYDRGELVDFYVRRARSRSSP
jgi:spore germination protein YaaH